MVSTAFPHWSRYRLTNGPGVLPNIFAEASADQELIMTAICETKGAVFDGTDCVGELDDTPVTVGLVRPTFLIV